MIMMNGFTLGFFFPKQARLVNDPAAAQKHETKGETRREVEITPSNPEIEYSPLLHIHRRF
ncbi:hypothetical protein [Rhizobium sp. TRM95796]|uniref:hypothetical protein n=1 Tax=Rhizobium sp. TRM95796 TaxID=2979862 RepID=UPI0021E9443F|nr:hypothetical protein [Rhizobium sp. TRM95796]MCV3767832.1 hypothetical protein [Rhizobium sp. TRM95796]